MLYHILWNRDILLLFSENLILLQPQFNAEEEAATSYFT